MPHSPGSAGSSGAEGFLNSAQGLCSWLGDALGAELLSLEGLCRWDTWKKAEYQAEGRISPPSFICILSLFSWFFEVPKALHVSPDFLPAPTWVLLSCRNNNNNQSKERILFSPKTSFEWKFLPIGSIRTDQWGSVSVFWRFLWLFLVVFKQVKHFQQKESNIKDGTVFPEMTIRGGNTSDYVFRQNKPA